MNVVGWSGSATLGGANEVEMPIVSRFFGIVIAFYWEDHHPPHFHAKYSGHEALIDIRDGSI